MTIHKKEITLQTSKGVPFLADIHFADEASADAPLILFLHGFKGFKDWGHFDLLARAMAEKGIHFLKFNFSLNGTTVDRPTDFDDLDAFGKNTLTREHEETLEMITWCKTAGTIIPGVVHRGPLIVAGHSRGGGIALTAGIQDARVDKVIALAPVSDFGAWQEKFDMESWRRDEKIFIPNARTGQLMPLDWTLAQDYLDNRELLDIGKAVATATKPVLIIHGTSDVSTSAKESKLLAAANEQVRYFAVPGADHTFGGAHPWTEDSLPDDSIRVSEAMEQFIRN